VEPYLFALHSPRRDAQDGNGAVAAVFNGD
jgi:hypothetical protein